MTGDDASIWRSTPDGWRLARRGAHVDRDPDADARAGAAGGAAERTGARSPEACDELFARHLNAGDLDALVALYDPACSLVRRDGTVAVGHAAIREALGRLVTMRPAIEVRIVKVVTSGDALAMVYNDWTLTVRPADGPPVQVAGKAIEVVRRAPDGTWRVVLDDPFARD